jgi:hypothetical protein
MHAKHGKLFRKKAKKKSLYTPPPSSSLEILHHAFLDAELVRSCLRCVSSCKTDNPRE